MGAEYTRVYEESLVSSTVKDRVRLQILRTPISEPAHRGPTQYSTQYITITVYFAGVKSSTRDYNQYIGCRDVVPVVTIPVIGVT